MGPDQDQDQTLDKLRPDRLNPCPLTFSIVERLVLLLYLLLEH